MKGARLLGIAIIIALAMSEPSAQADGPVARPVKAPTFPFYDWTGWYFGAHVGYGRGSASVVLSDPAPTSSSSSFGSLYGGLQLGYNYVLPSNILIGLEGDMSFPNYLATDDNIASRPAPRSVITEQLDYMASLRGRVGYVVRNWLFYATGGFAWAQGRFIEFPGVIDPDSGDKALAIHPGWAAGAGIERAITSEWTARLEYLYRSFANAGVTFPSGNGYDSSWD